MSAAFEYTYSAKQQEEIEKIRSKYVPKQETKLEQLKRLDRETEKKGTVVAITVGTIGILIMGAGMSLCLVWTEVMSLMVAGIITGIVGMGIAGTAYPLYTNITKKERAKVADQIIALSNELSFEN